MKPNFDPATISREAILAFLQSSPPFNQLSPQTLEDVSDKCRSSHYHVGDTILERGVSVVSYLSIIYQGRVRVFLKDESGEVTFEEFRGPGQAVGQLAILRGSLSNLDAVAEEDTVCLLLAAQDFLRLTNTELGFCNYYLKALSEGYITQAFERLQRPKVSMNTEGSLYLFSVQVGDLARRRPVTVPGDETIQNAAAMMTDRRVGCLLVTDPSEKIVGIITDRDLRTKVVGGGIDYTRPVASIMASPVKTIPSHTLAFDALLEMMKNRVHHLALERRGQVVGVLSGHDLMVAQGSSPLYLMREIRGQKNIERLYDLSLQSPRVVRSLIKEGAKAGHVNRMITLINDSILERLLTLLAESLGQPPVPYCWLLMGSEGRREQTFRTDQDNGLIYRDPESSAQRRATEEYFEIFSREAVRHLVACGFPRCHGEIMAENPKWRQPLSVWQQYFDQWITTPVPKDVLHATIFFDFRPGFGDIDLGRKLRDYLTQRVNGQEVFLRFLANDCLATPPALSFFGRFILEKKGPDKSGLDLKARGLVPFVDFARLMSLKHGIKETNTLERLQLLGQNGRISSSLAATSTQAYEFLMQLRLIHQMAMDEEALEPDNLINPHELNELDRRTLRDTFNVIGEIKGFLKEAFHLATV